MLSSDLFMGHQVRLPYLMTGDTYFSCGPEKVYFIDPEVMRGTVMNSVDLDAMVAREHEELDSIAGEEVDSELFILRFVFKDKSLE